VTRMNPTVVHEYVIMYYLDLRTDVTGNIYRERKKRKIERRERERERERERKDIIEIHNAVDVGGL